MSLRLRLTITYIALLIPAMIVFGIVSYLVASRRIYGALDDNLSSQVEAVRSAVSSDGTLSADETLRRLRALDAATISEFQFRMISPSGSPIFASSRAAFFNIPVPAQLSAAEGQFVTRGKGNAQARMVYETISSSNGDLLGYIVGAVSYRQTDAAIEVLRGVFLVGGVLVVVLTAGPAYMLAGRALRPVRDVSNLAAAIERTGRFDVSLPPPGTKGETVELIRTFNAMIGLVNHLLQSQKAFLAESSHELRRPLTVIRTYLDLLDHPDLQEADLVAATAVMRQEAEAMSRLITDLLILSRDQNIAERRVELDLTSICEAVLSQFSSDHPAHSFSFHSEGPEYVEGDPAQIRRVLTNLLQNAGENTPAGGLISLAVEQKDGNVLIAVSDEGAGIPAEEQAHVFERFYRGTRAQQVRYDGVGLGLAIVKHLTEAHAGRTWFHSEEGRGSTFYVELPALKASTPTLIPG